MIYIFPIYIKIEPEIKWNLQFYTIFLVQENLQVDSYALQSKELQFLVLTHLVCLVFLFLNKFNKLITQNKIIRPPILKLDISLENEIYKRNHKYIFLVFLYHVKIA